MAATQRSETEMKRKMAAVLQATKDPIEKLRCQCLSRGAAGIKGIARVFRIMDDDGNRQLSYPEFKKGLHDYGVYLESEAEYRAAFDSVDKDQNNNLSFDEFLAALRPPMSKRRVDLIRMAFNKCDKTHDGQLTVEDLRGVYNGKKHPKYLTGQMTEDQVFLEFLRTFDSPNDPDGVVTWEEFLNYYSGVSASIDLDSYFDLMMRNSWKL
eukprot:m.38133 g.38133  ORF g.38133 m.38133 type:complete len:210 (+) comp11611_c0_seq1:75-704(+)